MLFATLAFWLGTCATVRMAGTPARRSMPATRGVRSSTYHCNASLECPLEMYPVSPCLLKSSPSSEGDRSFAVVTKGTACSRLPTTVMTPKTCSRPNDQNPLRRQPRTPSNLRRSVLAQQSRKVRHLHPPRVRFLRGLAGALRSQNNAR